jgi:hypothetical protein
VSTLTCPEPFDFASFDFASFDFAQGIQDRLIEGLGPTQTCLRRSYGKAGVGPYFAGLDFDRAQSSKSPAYPIIYLQSRKR